MFMWHFFLGRKTFLSLEKQTLVDPAALERVRGPPGRQPTYGSYTGWQSAVRSHGQARRRGLTLSTSWSLWVYHGHLHDMESEQPTVWLVSPLGASTPAPRLGRDPTARAGSHRLPASSPRTKREDWGGR